MGVADTTLSNSRPRTFLPVAVGILIVAVLYLLSRQTTLPAERAAELAAGYQFGKHPLSVINSGTRQKIREVHPSLERFAAWISFVGAAITIVDLDNDGLPNDIIYVDSGFDEVIVCPAPTTEKRFDAFRLPQLESAAINGIATAPMGTLVGDYNEDGWPVLVYYWGRSPVVYTQLPEPHHENSTLSLSRFEPTELIIAPEIWFTSCATQADLDGDGHYDLIIGNYGPDGAKTLDPNADGTEEMMGSWARATNGGKTRLFLSKEQDGSRGFEEAQDVMSHDDACSWTFAAGVADLDGDLLPEFYLVHDFGADRLFHNRSTPGHLEFEPVFGEREFTKSRSKTLGWDTFNGMGVDFVDLNQDGDLDMLVSNITSNFGFHQSNFAFLSTGDGDQFHNGIAPYVDKSEELGLSRSGFSWDVKAGDFNNDGVSEIILATGMIKGETDRWPEMHELAISNEEIVKHPFVYPTLREDDDVAGHEINPFFVRDGDRFYDVAPFLESSSLDTPMLSRGIAVADVDGDGRLDFGLANHFEESFFFRNSSEAPGQFLGLHVRLRLPTSESTPEPSGESLQASIQPGHPTTEISSLVAIGAKATIRFRREGREITLSDQVDGGSGHSGQSAPDLHFGLGSFDSRQTIDVELKWRDREGGLQSSRFADVATGWHTIYLGGD